MKHPKPVLSNSGNALIRDVYAILDSRIQYIEYLAQNQLDSCKKAKEPSSDKGEISHSLLTNFEQLLGFLQELNHSLKLLQTLRTWLRDDNVSIILQLLTNKNYLRYSEESLESILKINSGTPTTVLI